MTASLLPLPDDPRFQLQIDFWNEGMYVGFPYPRSVWLRDFERILREHFPQSNAASRKLTARHYAPFPLAAGHDVP